MKNGDRREHIRELLIGAKWGWFLGTSIGCLMFSVAFLITDELGWAAVFAVLFLATWLMYHSNGNAEQRRREMGRDL